MKKIILLILLAFSFAITFSQTYPVTQILGSPQTLVLSKGGLKADSSLIIPSFTDTNAANKSTYIKNYPGNIIRAGDQVYVRNANATKWLIFAQSGGISGTVTSISQGYGISNSPNPITTTGTIKVDTSVSGLSGKYVRILDTSVMLSKYLRKIDTATLSNRINLKVNISDTSSMLSSYLRKVDTVSLSNRINLKVNVSDTSSMLSPYLRKVDTTNKFVNSITRIPGKDSIIFYVNSNRYAIKDSSGGAGTVTRAVDTIYRTPGKDSIIFTINGIRRAIKDSLGVGGSGTPGGPTNSLQYNNNGNFGGDANLIYNGNSLGIGNPPSLYSKLVINDTFHSVFNNNDNIPNANIWLNNVNYGQNTIFSSINNLNSAKWRSDYFGNSYLVAYAGNHYFLTQSDYGESEIAPKLGLEIINNGDVAIGDSLFWKSSNNRLSINAGTNPNSALTVNGADGINFKGLPKTNYNYVLAYDSASGQLGYKTSTGGSGTVTKAVDTIYRIPGKDSIIYTINGTRRAMKDSVGKPAGQNYSLQYNNSGTFGGDAKFLYNGSNLFLGDVSSSYSKLCVGDTFTTIQNSYGSSNAQIQLQNNDFNGATAIYSEIGGGPVGKWRSDYNGSNYWVAYGGNHYFYTNGDIPDGGTSKLTIFNNGNVAVGDSLFWKSSNNRLSINAGTNPNSALTVNGADGINFKGLPKTNYNYVLAYDSASGQLGYKTSTGGSGTVTRAVDTIYRTPGKDSIIFTINGIRRAIKDSIGSGGGGGISSYGYFFDKSEQCTDSSTTGQSILLEIKDTAIANGFHIRSGSKGEIIADSTGLFNFQISVQFWGSEDRGPYDASVWMKKNGHVIRDAIKAIKWIDGFAVLTYNNILSINIGDTIEYNWTHAELRDNLALICIKPGENKVLLEEEKGASVTLSITPVLGGGGSQDLQSVLNIGHSLINERNYQGTDAGSGNTGNYVNAFGLEAAKNNSGNDVNAIGTGSAYGNNGNHVNAMGGANNNIGNDVNAFGGGAAQSNSGSAVNAFGGSTAQGNSGSSVNAFGPYAAQNNSGTLVNAFGTYAGQGNIFSNVNLFGQEASASDNNQVVFSKSAENIVNARIDYNCIDANHKYSLPNKDGYFMNANLPIIINSEDSNEVYLTNPDNYEVINLRDDTYSMLLHFPDASNGCLSNGQRMVITNKVIDNNKTGAIQLAGNNIFYRGTNIPVTNIGPGETVEFLAEVDENNNGNWRTITSLPEPAVTLDMATLGSYYIHSNGTYLITSQSEGTIYFPAPCNMQGSKITLINIAETDVYNQAIESLAPSNCDKSKIVNANLTEITVQQLGTSSTYVAVGDAWYKISFQSP